jgi:hypothetical protein
MENVLQKYIKSEGTWLKIKYEKNHQKSFRKGNHFRCKPDMQKGIKNKKFCMCKGLSSILKSSI